MLSIILWSVVGCGLSSSAPATDSQRPVPDSSPATRVQDSASDTGGAQKETGSIAVGTGDSADSPGANGGVPIEPDGPGEFLSLSLTFDGITGHYEVDKKDWFETFIVTNPDGACVPAEWIIGGGVTGAGGDVMVAAVLESASVGTPTPAGVGYGWMSSVMVESWDGRGTMYASGGTWTVVSETKSEMVLSLNGASLCLPDELGVDLWEAAQDDCEPTTTGEVVITGYRELHVPDLENGGPAVTLESGESLCYPIYF